MTLSSQASQELIAQCQGLVRSLAMQIHRKLPPHVDLDDVIAYGQVGLAEAAQDFDPSRGSRFSTYAYYRIRGAIYDGLAKMTWFSRNHYHEVRYEQMAGEVLQASGETPATPEKDPEAAIRWFRDLSRALAVVYLSTQTDPGEESKGGLVLTDSARFAPPAQAICHEISQRLRELIDALPSDEGVLIRAAYFEGLTLQEAGRKLGISKSWATRLHAKALRRLGRSLRLLGLAS